MLLFISWLFLVWNPLDSNPDHIKACGIRPASHECDALGRVDLQRILMETGIQLSWNLWSGASAKARQKCFDWRMLICEDQSITQGRFGFNQRLMKTGQVLKVVSVSLSLSAKHLRCLPSELVRKKSSELLPNSLIFCSTSDELPGSQLQPLAAVPFSWCVSVAWDLGFPVCCSSAVSCPAPQRCPVQWGAGQPEFQCWPFAESDQILSIHPDQK